MARLFISVQHLDTWIEQGRATLRDNEITTAEGAVYQLAPAVLFAALAGGERDPGELLGRVKTHHQLAEMGAEHYQDSVILGEAAYQVVEGFVGEPVT